MFRQTELVDSVPLAAKYKFGYSPSHFVSLWLKNYDIFSKWHLIFVLCTQGGRHIDYVADQVVSKLIDVVKKRNKAGVAVKPFQVVILLTLAPFSKESVITLLSFSSWSNIKWLNCFWIYCYGNLRGYASLPPGEEPHVAVCQLPGWESHLWLSD